MEIMDYINIIGTWVLSNIPKLLFSAFSIIVGYLLHKVVSRETEKLVQKKRLEQHIAYTISRFTKWLLIFAIASVILSQFGVTIGAVTGFITIIGGTIIGFATINTLGNAIAGIIVMINRPFRIGDRVLFKEMYADIQDIGLIYTKMTTNDNISVSLPNQELLKSEIINFGTRRVIRRSVQVTCGYEYDDKYVKKALLEAAGQTRGILDSPKPHVRIESFMDYGVRYVLYVFLNDIKGMLEIVAELYTSVLENCKEYDIDLSTTMQLRQVTVK